VDPVIDLGHNDVRQVGRARQQYHRARNGLPGSQREIPKTRKLMLDNVVVFMLCLVKSLCFWARQITDIR
jgi:hypothetical protein